MTAIQALIDKSGNAFHAKVITKLRSLGWEVSISPYYNDNQTNKAREIDIVAEKGYEFSDYTTDKMDVLVIKLFIECKYINQDTVFWFDDKDLQQAQAQASRKTGIPRGNIHLNDFSHWQNRKVAKLFSTGKGETDNEPFFKAISQILNASIYFRIHNNIKKYDVSGIARYLGYSLIICNSFEKFHGTKIGEEEYRQLDETKFELEVNYSYQDQVGIDNNEYFLIDIVNFEKIDLFFKELEEHDIKTVTGFHGS